MSDVEVVLLGVAQDGGVPQAGCSCERCLGALVDPYKKRMVTSLGILDFKDSRYWLIDATPDMREQIGYVLSTFPGFSFSGIFLTHAHIGHYTGLIHLGKESLNSHKLPVYTGNRMKGFLLENEPWKSLAEQENIAIEEFYDGEEIYLRKDLSISPISVPHRNEHTNTYAFKLIGRKNQLFYCPDIDSWEEWDQDVDKLADRVDILLLDGTFFDNNELPHRDLTAIPHPFVVDTAMKVMDRNADVFLVHLNHTNPILDSSPEREWLMDKGIKVGVFGNRWRLS